jgi:hypothetical protein
MYYTKNTPEAKSYYQCTGNNYPNVVEHLPRIKAPSHITKKQGNYPTVGRNDRQGYDSANDPYQGYESDYHYSPRKDYTNDYYNSYDLANQRSRNRGRYPDYDVQDPDPQGPDPQYDTDYRSLMSDLDRAYFENGGQDTRVPKSTISPPINPPLSVKSHAKLTKPGGRDKSKLQHTNKLSGNGGGKPGFETKAPEKTITLETTGLPPPISKY